MRALARAIGSLGYVGFLKPAPGTWGSAAALPLAALVHYYGGFYLLVALTVVAFVIGWWATKIITSGARGSKDHDPSWVVIDELVGQWIALFPVSLAAEHLDMEIFTFWPGWITAFLLFRLFDIVKPNWVGAMDELGTPLGVMLDDVVAGIYAAGGVLGLAYLYHEVI